jgi:DNA-directed RNA polymerase subunit L
MEKKKYSSNKWIEVKLKIKVLSKSKNELKIEIEGTGHTLCNLLQKRLLEDKNVDLAGYDVPHPLYAKGILYVRMDGASKPETALIKAANKALKLNKDFRTSLDVSLKS